MYKYFILVFLFIISSCKDNTTNPAESTASKEWFYYSDRIGEDFYFINRFSSVNGDIERIVDSARMYAQAVNNKIIYVKRSKRTSADSGEVTDRNLYISDLDGSNARSIMDEALGHSNFPCLITPDLKKVVLILPMYGNYDPKTFLTISDGSYKRYETSYARLSDFKLSNAGDKIAYPGDKGGINIFEIESGISGKVPLVDNTDYTWSDICWTNDDKSLLVAAIIDSIKYLFKIDIETGQCDTLLKNFSVANPTPFDNGKKILFEEKITITTSNYVLNIWTCNADGSGLEKINLEPGIGYELLLPNPFINESEIIAGRHLAAENSRADDLVVINIRTKQIRVIKKNFIDLM